MREISRLCSHFLETASDSSAVGDAEAAKVDSLYDDIVLENKPQVELDCQRIMKDSSVQCLAVNGYSFNPVPLCLRCQRIYSGWKHWKDHRARSKTTKDAQEKIEYTSAQMESAAVTKSHADVSYCTESVAAAKLYSLRTEKLVLQ
ncbi:hypothetical protein AYO20_04336 [Fonsecaea nubica]|uniref:Uncharacterized protein n=1 Tax=Fonsecaea nubica TaxID=856822 RepID=A0A178D2M8_9EURO|nr:hypothetical protein AYO20_04336 [Fonsecaea nubica]OAL36440.1 hypothetical protein AYO20_04336 [Fonsecaea nubica]